MLPRISLSVFVFVLVSTPLCAQAPDFDAALDDTVAILQDLVRLDTSNPPGNETLVAEYAKELLETEGIPGEIFALDPARGNLVARLAGNGSKRPILIMGHSDVVGVDRDQWTLDPFDAMIKDGFVYGRGAADDKGMIAAAIQMMLMIKRANIALDRDIILLIEAGEEGTTQWGIDYMVSNHLDKIEAECALNEGGDIHVTDDKVDVVKVTTAEKAIWRGIKLIARGGVSLDAGPGHRRPRHRDRPAFEWAPGSSPVTAGNGPVPGNRKGPVRNVSRRDHAADDEHGRFGFRSTACCRSADLRDR